MRIWIRKIPTIPIPKTSPIAGRLPKISNLPLKSRNSPGQKVSGWLVTGLWLVIFHGFEGFRLPFSLLVGSLKLPMAKWFTKVFRKNRRDGVKKCLALEHTSSTSSFKLNKHTILGYPTWMITACKSKIVFQTILLYKKCVGGWKSNTPKNRSTLPELT